MFSSKRFWLYIALVSLLVCAGLGWQQVFAQTENARYFPATGHWVTDEFLVKYQEIPNPSELYGAPITESFEDTLSGRKIQYFEKVRFELHPELPEGLKVTLSKLGEFLYEEGQTLSAPANAPACRTFVQSEYAVCYAFQDFFEANGDVAQFGFPISGFEIHDGWIVQYFQNARFEWHPENSAGKKVTVSNLGYRYFYDRQEDPTLLNPVPRDEAPDLPIFNLQAHAFASSAILPVSGSQTMYIIVQDQYYNPVANADVDFTVILPDGTTKDYKAGRTNAAGVSKLSFEISSGKIGIANVLVNVSYDNGALTAKTRTSFSLWW